MQTSLAPETPSVVAALALLDELVRLGVRHVVLAPGSRSAPLAYAAQHLDRSGALTLHVRIDERSAAFTALGLAKVSRTPAAVITTSGTATANLHPAVLEADHGQVPLLLLTADRPPELRGVGANQATEQVGLFGPARTRLAVDLETPAGERIAEQCRALRTTAARAVSAATGTGAAVGSGAGPVHLNLPYRDPLVPGPSGAVLPEDCRGRPDGSPWVRDECGATAEGGAPWPTPARETPTQPTPGHPGSSSSLPTGPGTLVAVGDLPTAQHRRSAFAWAAAHALPVIAEPGAPPAPEHADVLVPHGALALHATDWLESHPVEAVVVVGRPTLGRQVGALLRAVPAVHLVTETQAWADPTHAQASVHPFAALETRPAREVQPTGWTQAWRELGGRLAAAVTRQIDGDELVTGTQVLSVVDRAVPDAARIFLGSSSAARDHHLGIARPRSDVDVVASRGLAGIDGCLSTAGGLALADPDVRTVAVVGDLTFLHDSGALVIGPDEPLPHLTVVVLDDCGGGIFTTLEHGSPERAADFDRVFATPTRTDICALARAHGWTSQTVTSSAELAQSLREKREGIHVIRVPVELHRRRQDTEALRRAAGSLV